jgi:hypothetical protein
MLVNTGRHANESTGNRFVLLHRGIVSMAVLDAKTRNALSDSAFALPGRHYPIHDINHARAALSRVSQFGSPEEKAKVRAAVHRRYPQIAEQARSSAIGLGRMR